MNVWISIWAMTYIVPVFWLLGDFDLVVEEMGDWFDLSYSMAKSLAILAILFWPVAMIAKMMMVNKDDI